MAQDYFASFTTFDYEPTAPLLDEFRRLALSRQWKDEGKTYRKERQKCLGSAFDQYFGTDSRNLEGWQGLCRDVAIDPAPPSITKCRKELSKVFVNIVDLIEARRIGTEPRRFPSRTALRRYSLETGKIFSKRKAKQDGYLGSAEVDKDEAFKPVGSPALVWHKVDEADVDCTKMESRSTYNARDAPHSSIFDDSDVENLSFGSAATELRDEISYWFGQKYFECVISQQVLLEGDLGDAPSAVDSRLFRDMRDFPYESCLSTLSACGREELSKRPQSSGKDPRTRLLILVGWIVHEGSSRAKQQMLQTVRGFHRGRHLKRRDCSRSASGSRGEESAGQSSASANPGRYSVAVNNHGVKVGVKPMYSMEPVSSDPSLWKTVLSFKGQKFEGTASTVKQAQHEAARQACKFFDLHVS